MAKKDVVLYFLQVQNQYIELLNNVKDLKEALQGGYLDEEHFQQAQTEIDIVKNNYERLAYVMMLLNQPQRKSKKDRELKENLEWYNALQGSSKEAILDENRDALADFKKLIKEIKESNDN